MVVVVVVVVAIKLIKILISSLFDVEARNSKQNVNAKNIVDRFIPSKKRFSCWGKLSFLEKRDSGQQNPTGAGIFELGEKRQKVKLGRIGM